MDKLKELHDDKQMVDAWIKFQMDLLDEEALKRVYKGEDTSDIKEVKEHLQRAFSRLRERYTPKEERKVASKGV